MDSALHVLLDETRKYTESVMKKIPLMQDVFISKNENLFSQEEENEIRYYLRASIYKFYLATLSLEQLWSLSHSKRDKLTIALENSLDTLNCSDDDLFLISFVFEGFLFQGCAFLDFYMLYLCLFLKTGHQGSISKSKFEKAIKKANHEMLPKSHMVENYFQNDVFSNNNSSWLMPENWGVVLRSLRDKIAHRDRLRPSFDGDEKLLDKVLFDWPTLQETTYDRFCQYMQNGMFEMLRGVSQSLYDLEWAPGPYRNDLYKDQ